jgi:hypothetical protein
MIPQSGRLLRPENACNEQKAAVIFTIGQILKNTTDWVGTRWAIPQNIAIAAATDARSVVIFLPLALVLRP